MFSASFLFYHMWLGCNPLTECHFPSLYFSRLKISFCLATDSLIRPLDMYKARWDCPPLVAAKNNRPSEDRVLTSREKWGLEEKEGEKNRILWIQPCTLRIPTCLCVRTWPLTWAAAPAEEGCSSGCWQAPPRGRHVELELVTRKTKHFHLSLLSHRPRVAQRQTTEAFQYKLEHESSAAPSSDQADAFQPVGGECTFDSCKHQPVMFSLHVQPLHFNWPYYYQSIKHSYHIVKILISES